jgi:hypothetical protein
LKYGVPARGETPATPIMTGTSAYGSDERSEIRATVARVSMS